ncbi:MAG: DUF2478 domain-containing protein [Thermoanaerobaculales bacterium]|jgi:nucleoside-triphosphatase THEP1/energy-coupling factor transporter transmembrane protein EcfT|nr:DUF2478 domain-containing protein [Thermoanaerobaculales bacterium]
MRIEAVLGLAVAVAASFSSRIEIVAGAALLACLVALFVDRRVLSRVLGVGVVLGAVFAAAAAGAAVAWASGLGRGLVVGGSVLLRLVVLATAAAVVARSVDADGIQRALARLGLRRLGLVLGLALNTLPHLADTAVTVWAAHRVRSAGRWAALGRLPRLAEVLLAHTGRVANQAAAAAALRGHAGLASIEAPAAGRPPTVVVTGPPGSGKTPVAEAVAEALAGRGVAVFGFVQPAIREDGEKAGFRLRALPGGETAELARRVAPGEGAAGTSYRFSPGGFALAARSLARAAPGAVLVVDELGPVELRGGGHWPAVERAVRTGDLAGMVVVVRRTLVPTLVEALDAADAVVVDLELETGDPVAAVVRAIVTDP